MTSWRFSCIRSSAVFSHWSAGQKVCSSSFRADNQNGCIYHLNSRWHKPIAKSAYTIECDKCRIIVRNISWINCNSNNVISKFIRPTISHDDCPWVSTINAWTRLNVIGIMEKSHTHALFERLFARNRQKKNEKFNMHSTTTCANNFRMVILRTWITAH